VLGCCVHGNEPSGTITCAELLCQLNYYQLVYVMQIETHFSFIYQSTKMRTQTHLTMIDGASSSSGEVRRSSVQISRYYLDYALCGFS
jgi:hypothetical protein